MFRGGSVLELAGRLITQITNIIIKRRGHTTTVWEDYQKASLDTAERLERSWCVVCRNMFGMLGL